MNSSVPHQSDSRSNDSTSPQFVNSSSALRLNTRNLYFSENDDAQMHWQGRLGGMIKSWTVGFQNNGWATMMANNRERLRAKKTKMAVYYSAKMLPAAWVWNRPVLSFFNHQRPLCINTTATCVIQPHWWRQSHRIRLRACACVMTHQMQHPPDSSMKRRVACSLSPQPFIITWPIHFFLFVLFIYLSIFWAIKKDGQPIVCPGI